MGQGSASSCYSGERISIGCDLDLYPIFPMCTPTPQVSSINRVLRALQEDQSLHWTQLRSPGGS